MEFRTEQDRRQYLIMAAKAGITQTEVVLQALKVVSPEPRDKLKIDNALACLDTARKDIDKLYK